MMIKRLSCNICGFPDSGFMGNTETMIGMMCNRGLGVDEIKNHFLDSHPEEYCGLLQEIKQLKGD